MGLALVPGNEKIERAASINLLRLGLVLGLSEERRTATGHEAHLGCLSNHWSTKCCAPLYVTKSRTGLVLS